MNALNMSTLKLLGLSVLAAFLVTPAAQAQTAASSSANAPNLFGACATESPSKQKKLTQYSLYYENLKNKDYKAALPHLRWMLRCAPTFGGQPGNPSAKNVNRALDAYTGMAKSASGETANAYIDTALTLIDTAPSILKEGGVEVDSFEWTFKRGYFIQSNSDLLPDRQVEALEAYRKAYDMSPDKLIQKDTTYYLNAILSNYAQRGETAKLLKLVRNLQSRYGDSQQITDLIGKYLPRVPPKERLSFYEKRLENNPENVQLIQKMMELYRQQDRRDKIYELGKRLQKMEPSPGVTRTLARMYLEDDESRKALEMYQELTSMEDAEVQARDYYNMGLAYKAMGSLSKARTYLRNAVDKDSGFGKAYLAIGDLYVTAVDNCGSMNREDKAVYWLATDYYQKAKQASSSLASTADSKIGTYSKYYPSQEDLFFWEKEAGDSYRVDSGCYAWIDETTTVRSP
jgi:tetratricopeptide (TPR) repeat protein